MSRECRSNIFLLASESEATINTLSMAGLTISDPKCGNIEPCQEYKFVDPLPDKYLCGICKSVLSEPHVTECCGQHFCKTCIEKSTVGKWNARPRRCPLCRKINVRHFQYLPFKRQINELLVYCPRKARGCKVQVAYSKRDDHDEDCEYEEVECTKWCGDEVFRKDLEYHIENECELRDYECELCGEVGVYREITSEEHESVCPEVIIECPNSCNVKFKRKDIESHKSVCVEEVSCDFAEVGCQETPKRKDQDSHMYSNLKQHLSQLMTAYTAIQLEFKAYREEYENNTVIDEKDIDSEDKILTRRRLLYNCYCSYT